MIGGQATPWVKKRRAGQKAESRRGALLERPLYDDDDTEMRRRARHRG